MCLLPFLLHVLLANSLNFSLLFLRLSWGKFCALFSLESHFAILAHIFVPRGKGMARILVSVTDKAFRKRDNEAETNRDSKNLQHRL